MTAFSPAGSFPALSRAAEASRRAVEVFLGEHAGLPVARPPVSTPGGVAVVTVADVDGLADWLAACGGTIRRGTPDDGVQTWQLYTSLPPRADGSRVPVRVVTAAAEDVPVADEVLSAVVSGGPRATARGPLAPERFAEIRARVVADYPTVCTGCGHGRLVHAIPAPSPCAVRGWLAPGWRCECPGWQHPYLPVGRHDGRQDRRDAIALLAEVERMADELAECTALELGSPEGRVSATCADVTHPTWLRHLDDIRGCPWCALAARPSRADVLRQVAAEMVDYCPDHGTGGTSRMTCACPVAHDLLGQADRAEAADAESESQLRARTLREGAAEVRARCLGVPGRLTARVAELVEQRDDALVDLVGLGAAGAAADVQAAPDDEWVRCSASHCPNAERFTKAPERGWEHCHMDTWLCPKHAPATPAPAMPWAMARADGTGLLHCETPARGDTITERGHQMACTPPVLPWAHRLGEDGLAAFLLDLAAAAGGYWQHDGHAEVLTRIEQVFAEHRAALAEDGPDACGEGLRAARDDLIGALQDGGHFDARADRLLNAYRAAVLADSTCGHDADDRCPCAVCATCRVRWCECTCPPSAPDGAGEGRG